MQSPKTQLKVMFCYPLSSLSGLIRDAVGGERVESGNEQLRSAEKRGVNFRVMV